MEGDGKPVDSREGRSARKNQAKAVHSMRLTFALVGMILLTLFIGIVSAADFTPQGDIDLRGVYGVKNATNMTAVNITATGFFIGNGSKLTGVGNSTITESYLKGIFIQIANQGDLNVNSSTWWAGINSIAGILGSAITNDMVWMGWAQITPHFYFKNQTYNKSEIDSNLSLKLGITDQRYNETDRVNSVNSTLQNINTTLSGRIDSVNSSLSLYNDTAKINSVNSTLNLVAANASINHTSIVFGLWNSTWDNSWVNIWAYNQTLAAVNYLINTYNVTWSSTFNATYDNYPNILNETGRINSVNSTLSNVNTTLSGRIDSVNSTAVNSNATLSGRVDSLNTTITNSNASWISTYNATYAGYAANVSRNWTLDTFTNWNSTWDNSFMNIWNYNQTTATINYLINTYNSTWSSTYNSTYAGYATNVSRNWTLDTYNNWGQWWYNMTTPAIDYVNNNFIQKGTADAWVIKYQNISNIPTCTGTDKLKFDGTTLSCATDETGAPGSGDIESVVGDDFITNGSTTGPVNLIFNKTRLNETIISKGVDAGFNQTDNATYAGYITFNQTSLIANLTNGDCAIGSLVIGVQANGTVLCATDSSYNATYAGFTTFNQTSLIANLTNGDCSAGNLVIGIQANGSVLCASDAGGGNYFNQQLNTTNNVTFVNITMTNGSGDTFFLKRVFVYGIDLNITIYNSNLSNYNLGIAVNNTAKLVYTINTTANIQNLLNSTGVYSIPLTINTTLNIQNLYNSTALLFAQLINTTVNIQNLYNATLKMYAAPNTTAGIQYLINDTNIKFNSATVTTNITNQNVIYAGNITYYPNGCYRKINTTGIYDIC